MKKYFFKKSLGWYILITTVCVLAEMIWMFVMSIVSSIAPDTISEKILAEAMAYASMPIITLIFLFAGKRLVQKIQNDGIYTGEYSKYTYFFYPLACASTELINAVNKLVRSLLEPAYISFDESTFAHDLAIRGIYYLIQFLILIFEFVVASKIIGSLLCAVTEGEESEKRFFSKIGLPVCVSFAGVLIIEYLLIGLYDYNIITFAGEVLCLLTMAVMLLGLKYKYDDIKKRNIICKALPFVYVGIQAITALLKIFNAVY